jgi:hypothetical protein
VASSATLLFALVSCGPSTKLTGTWKEPQVTGIPFKKVVAAVLSKDKTMGRIAEDEFIRSLPKGTEGVAAYSLIPESEKDDTEKVKARLQAAQVDGAVVFRLISADTEYTYNAGVYPATYATFYGYYGYAYHAVYDPGYLMSDRVIRVETNVYSVVDEKLVWSGASESFNPKSSRKLIDDVVRVVVKDLKRQGIVK